jgi:tetratricopeptide (TPR) repeat protein
MSHKKPSDDLPDFNSFFKNELGPCKAPRKKPKPDEFPPHLRPGNPDRWDDNAKYYAASWKLALVKELEAGHDTPPEQLAETCQEYARLCFIYGNPGEVAALAKMTLRQLSHQPEARKREGFDQLLKTFNRVYQLAHGCRFYAEAIEFVRYAIELAELIGNSTHRLTPQKPPFQIIWESWYLDLADSCLSAGRIDEALQALDAGAAKCDRSDLQSLRIRLDLFAVQIAFHHGRREDALRRCLQIIDNYDPKAPNQLPIILKAKGLYEEFCVEG